MPPEPGATKSLRARLGAGPLARAVGRVDVRLYRFVRADLHSATLMPSIRRFSMTGEHAALWYAIGATGLAVDARRRPRWRRAMLSVLVTQLLNTALKAVVRRRRPALEGLPALVSVPTSLSFPSAHASTSFAAARAYGGIAPALSRVLYGVAAAMALSRVYLGVHYPSDIAVGAVLGSVIAGASKP